MGVNWTGYVGLIVEDYVSILCRYLQSACLVASATGGLFAQPRNPPADGLRVFEVASVKRNLSGSGASEFKNTPDRLIIQNGRLLNCIEFAYKIYQDNLISAPAWLDSVRFDIEGKAAKAAPLEDLLVMLQSLLTSRFKLSFHLEQRESAVYALLPAGAVGSKTAARHRPRH